MTIINVILWTVLAILLLVAVCAGVIWLEKKYPGEGYDERQKIARGNAYRLSFWIGFLYFFGLEIAAILNREWNGASVDLYLLLLFGITLQAIAFHIYCLLTHAALPLSENPKVTIGGYFLLCAVNLARFTDDFYQELPLTGEESNKWVQMLQALLFFFLALMHLIQYLRREKE